MSPTEEKAYRAKMRVWWAVQGFRYITVSREGYEEPFQTENDAKNYARAYAAWNHRRLQVVPLQEVQS